MTELTQFGWTIMSPGKEIDFSSMLLTQTATTDYEELCKLDVLGIQDKGHQTHVQGAITLKLGGLLRSQTALESKPSFLA